MSLSKAAFARKYQAPAFDEDSRLDMLAERARQKLIKAFLDAAPEEDCVTGEEVQYMIGGLMVGIACIGASQFSRSDKHDADLREALIAMAPWAVDMMRQIGTDLPPLSDGN